MPNEVNVNINVSYGKGNVRENISPGGLNFTATGTGIIHQVVSIGTADEALDLGDVATPGFCYIRNNDPTNFVEVGVDGTNYVIKLKPGEQCFFRVDGSAVHAIADTAPCKIEYLIIED